MMESTARAAEDAPAQNLSLPPESGTRQSRPCPGKHSTAVEKQSPSNPKRRDEVEGIEEDQNVPRLCKALRTQRQAVHSYGSNEYT